MITTTPIPACLAEAETIELPRGTRVFQAGDKCEQFVFLHQGSIRVDLLAESGKGILLYRFGAGETCILTTACLLGGDAYNAEATVEESVKASMIPMTRFQDLLVQSTDFRNIVFSSFAKRLSALMVKVEEVAFISVDRRLAGRVLEINKAGKAIHVTHEQLAIDLGTAREVVSRKLSRWEENGWIIRERGSFTVIDVNQIERMASAG